MSITQEYRAYSKRLSHKSFGFLTLFSTEIISSQSALVKLKVRLTGQTLFQSVNMDGHSQQVTRTPTDFDSRKSKRIRVLFFESLFGRNSQDRICIKLSKSIWSYMRLQYVLKIHFARH